jgi:hypothetical protein
MSRLRLKVSTAILFSGIVVFFLGWYLMLFVPKTNLFHTLGPEFVGAASITIIAALLIRVCNSRYCRFPRL